MSTLKKMWCSGCGMALTLLFVPTTSAAVSGTVAALSSNMEIGTASSALNTEVSAQETEYYFVVHLKDGSKMVYPFAEKPTLTYQDQLLLLSTTKEKLEIVPGDVDKFNLAKTGDNDVTAIEEVVTKTSLDRRGNTLFFSGCRPSTQVQMYDLNGRLVVSETVGESGEVEISLQQQVSGVYLIRTATTTFKILKK